MGTDKATVDVGGRPLATRPLDALAGAGLDDVMLIGATDAHAALPGRAVADLWPGEGPVGGVLTALHAAFLVGASSVLVLACDLPAVTVETLAPLVDAAGPQHVVLGAVDGRRCPPNGVWPVALLPRLEDAFGDGASSFGELLDGVDVVEVECGDALADADDPGDLARFR